MNKPARPEADRPAPTGDGLDELVTEHELLAHLKIGRTTADRYVKNGVLPQPMRIGRLKRWRRGDIRIAMDRMAAAAGVAAAGAAAEVAVEAEADGAAP